VARWRHVLEPGLRLGKLHGSVCSGSEAVLEQRCANVLDERRLGHRRDVRVLRVRDGCLHRSVHTRCEAMLEQRCADVLGERTVGDDDMYESSVRGWCVHGSVRAGGEAVQQLDAADV
jgi:hypothetical protein